jgi:hypothetical protein
MGRDGDDELLLLELRRGDCSTGHLGMNQYFP